ncbi:amidase domain-containing protein [Frondihabitans australicus]|uniref:IPT/TIG domain-containing protein n=1 Tax=Frondihabitans australicus TaxID=386892 RepID=A0A495IJW4_9MICO|nr:amidase domain-containing protein [Frondihabitans australicus]RKR76257.1 IPT/TIG domain-containing protein [Frondihabitans australicus]
MKRRAFLAGGVAVAATAALAACTAASAGSGASKGAGAGSATAVATPAAPRVTSLSSTSGSLVGGETVALAGVSLTGVTRVVFNGVDSPSVTAVSATSVKAVVPSAVNFQPSSGGVVAYRGTTVVASARALTYTWAPRTGVDKQMQYAFAHWNAPTYNPAYLNFDSVGGDCQNFVSQSLLAGGLPKSSSWFYDSASSHSSSWGYAPAFNDLAPSLGFTRLTSAQESQVQIGDLAYFDWNGNGIPDHVMMVSAVSAAATSSGSGSSASGSTSAASSSTIIKLVGHNLDYDYRDLQTTITKDHPGATVWFYALPKSFR